VAIGTASGTMGVLIGDTNADGLANSAGIGQTKSQSGNPVSRSNFRHNANTDGAANSGDIGLVKSKSGNCVALARSDLVGFYSFTKPSKLAD
jgi:hypothetical protein